MFWVVCIFLKRSGRPRLAVSGARFVDAMWSTSLLVGAGGCLPVVVPSSQKYRLAWRRPRVAYDDTAGPCFKSPASSFSLGAGSDSLFSL